MDNTLGPGTILENRYEITCRLNEGGTASVYMAKRLGIHDNLTVAIKEISPDAVSRDEFENEVSLLVRLNHPNLPKVYDFFEQGDKYYLVMDYVEGTTLAAYVTDNGPFNAEESVAIGLQIANVFTYLHASRVIHRDLKPQNVMLDSDGQVKIIDFGVAKGEGSEGVFAYSEGTSAPEQRISGASDERSDIYSFGATLYYLLTGRYPSDLVRVAPVEGRTIKRDAAIPPDIEPVIRRCVAKEPENRYQTMAEVILALESLGAEPSELTSVGGPARRRTWITWFALASVLTLAGAVAIFSWLRHDAGGIIGPPPVVVTYQVSGPAEVAAGADAQFTITPLPKDPVTWEVYTGIEPKRLLHTSQDATLTVKLPYAGVYSVVAKSGDKVLGEVAQVATSPDFTLRKSVIQGYQLVTKPTGELIAPADFGGVPVVWDWTVTDPLGVAKTTRSTSGALTYVFKETGVYRIRLAAVYKVAEGQEVSAPSQERSIEVVRETPVGLATNPNPGFEEVLNGGPGGWTLVGSTTVLDSTVAYEGIQSVRIGGPTTHANSYATQRFIIQQASGRYTITARVKGKSVSGSERLEVRFRSATTGEYIRDPIRSTNSWTGNFDWQRLDVSYHAPADSFVIEIYLSLDGKGTIWFDQCVLYQS